MSAEVLSSLTAVLTAALVAITWLYAKSTKLIATETATAARLARDAAQVNLIQGLLNVQPLLEVRTASAEYVTGGSDDPYDPLPVRFSITIVNSGSGTAFNPTVMMRISDLELRRDEASLPPHYLAQTEQMDLTYAINREDWPRTREYLAVHLNPCGVLILECHDSFGSAVTSEVDLFVENGQARYGPPRRRYAGGPELNQLLGELIARLVDEGDPSSRL